MDEIELAAAVSNAGGMGSLAGGYLSPDRLRDEIRRLRAATSRPFAVNLFVPTPDSENDALVEQALRLLEPYRTELGLSPRPDVARWAEDFEAQLTVVIEEQAPVFSFTFGALTKNQMDRVRA